MYAVDYCSESDSIAILTKDDSDTNTIHVSYYSAETAQEVWTRRIVTSTENEHVLKIEDAAIKFEETVCGQLVITWRSHLESAGTYNLMYAAFAADGTQLGHVIMYNEQPDTENT